MSTWALVTLVVAGLLATAACSIDVSGDEPFVVHEEKRFTVNGPLDLTLRTFDGAVEVRSWDRDEVVVRIDRRGADAEQARAIVVDTMQEGNRISIDAQQPRVRREVVGFGIRRWPSVSLTVTVPRRVTLDARSGDGSIAVDDLAGTLSLYTSDGSIDVSRFEGALTAHTDDGSIRVDRSNGRVDVDSGDGSIVVRGRFEALRANTGDGAIRVEADEGSVMKTDWSVETGDGSIELRVPTAFDAQIDAHSGDGRVSADGLITAEQPIRAERDDTEDHVEIDRDRNSVRGSLGKGGHILRVRSGDGRIHIDRR